MAISSSDVFQWSRINITLELKTANWKRWPTILRHSSSFVFHFFFFFFFFRKRFLFISIDYSQFNSHFKAYLLTFIKYIWVARYKKVSLRCMRTAKALIRLRIRAVWSEPLLSAFRKKLSTVENLRVQQRSWSDNISLQNDLGLKCSRIFRGHFSQVVVNTHVALQMLFHVILISCCIKHGPPVQSQVLFLSFSVFPY